MKIDISHLTIPDNFHDITDFFVPEESPSSSVMYPGPKLVSQDPLFMDFINVLLEHARLKTKLEFSLEFIHEKKRIILRGHSIESIEGKVYIFRRLPSIIPKIEDLGMPKSILELLLSEKLNSGGLVIIAGETGQGKSTTAAAAISYRLRTFGSFCLTIEDPVELPLQGFYYSENDPSRRGVCFQTSIDSEKIPDAIKSSLRCYPAVSNSILFLGEIRDALMANEAIKIAANGHLVITTMHGSDLIIALKRFLSMASGHTNANEAEIRSMMSSVFRMVIHQRLEVFPSGVKKIRPKVLFSPNQASSIASRIKSGSLETLSTDVQAQNMLVAQGQSIISHFDD